MKIKYPDIDFEAVNSLFIDEYGKPGPKQNGSPVDKFSNFYTIIENAENGKYFTIAYWDKLRGMTPGTYWDLENMVELFAAVGIQSNEINFQPSPIKYTPISHMCLHKQAEDRIQQIYNNPKVIPDKLYFKGGNYDFRTHMYKDGRIEMDNFRVTPAEFIDKIGQYSINVDINGAAEVSCRTFDVLGLKSALIRPKLGIQYHNPLIPDYHYASLKVDDLGKWNEVADAYIDRFEELKKNPDEVEFLASNGRKWWEENGTIEAHANLLLKLIDLNKLI